MTTACGSGSLIDDYVVDDAAAVKYVSLGFTGTTTTSISFSDYSIVPLNRTASGCISFDSKVTG